MVTFESQPTSSSRGLGRANPKLDIMDTQSLILGPVSTPTPSIDAGRETPAVTYRPNTNSASMSSLRDLGFQTPTYTTTMPRGPFLQRQLYGDYQNNNHEPAPPIRPRKPPRLIHYPTLSRNNYAMGELKTGCKMQKQTFDF